MKFSHYSAAKIKEVHSTVQAENPDMKPRGLWLSVDGPDDWPSWVKRTHQQSLRPLLLRYRVVLDMTRILVLSTPQELDDFTTGFVTVAPWEKLLPDAPANMALRLWMNWKAVAELYAGIIIAPYQWISRIDHIWYYPWDCASGCVWDAAAVRSIKLLDRQNRNRVRDTQ